MMDKSHKLHLFGANDPLKLIVLRPVIIVQVLLG
jgi:hypothetical protein